MKDIRLRQKKTVTFANKENQNLTTRSFDQDKMLSCQRQEENGCRRRSSSVSFGSLNTHVNTGRGNRGRELEEVMDNMKNIITEMDYLKRLQEHDKQRIEMEKSNALESVKSFRRQIMRIIDSLDEKSTKDTLAKFEKMADKIQADIRACESNIKSVDNIENRKTTKNVRFGNNNNLRPKDAEKPSFGRQLSSQSVKDAERPMFKRQLSSMSSFEAARDTKRPLLTRQQSVDIDDNTERPRLNRQFSSLSVDSTSSEEQEQEYIRPKLPKSILSNKGQINKPAKVTSSGEHSVKLNGEKFQCNILGSCFLPGGRMLLVDSRNRKLKCLDKNFKVVDECSLSGQPWAVCCISDTEAAVAMGTDQCIQLVSFEGRLKLTKALSVQHDCFGIAFSKGEYFVTSHHVVNVYDKHGKHLRTFHKDNSGNDIFYGTYDIAASADGSKLYVADCKRNLIILNREGDVLSVYSDAEMKDAWGVCTDYLGNVFVCGYWSHNVIQLTPEGRKVAVVLDTSAGLKNPKSVCFDPYRSKFVVSKDSNSILVFDVKHT